MTKFLLADGCSYTDPSFRSLDESLPEEERSGWAMWPEHLGNSLSLEVINNGHSGSDNSTIHNRLIRNILDHGDDIKLVCVLWSGFDRFRFMNFRSSLIFHNLQIVRFPESPFVQPNSNDIMIKSGFPKWLNDFVSYKDFPVTSLIEGAFIDSFTYMNSIAEICEKRGIPYIFYQGVHPFKADLPPFNNDNIYVESLKRILKTSIYSHTEKRKNNIIGWPFIRRLGGSHLDLERRRKWDYPLPISPKDWHPNAEAQKRISEIFMKKYQELMND